MLRHVALLGILIAALPASASHTLTSDPIMDEEQARADGSACHQFRGGHDDVVDDTRHRVEEMLCSTALWLDSITGVDGSVSAARKTHGRLELSYYYSEFSGNKLRLRLRARSELPALKRRLSVFAGVGNEDEIIADRNEGFALRSEFPELADDGDDWLAGLGYSLPGSAVFQSDFRVGARRLIDTQVFVQNRLRYIPWSDRHNVLRLRETLFWTNYDALGSTTGMDLMHVLSERHLARLDVVGTATQNEPRMKWRFALLLYQHVSDRVGLAYELFSRDQHGDNLPFTERGGRIVVRVPLLQRRLFLDTVTGYTWHRIEPGEPAVGSFGVGVGLELPFGPDRPR